MTVWRKRHGEFGEAGLNDETRPGRPFVYGHGDVCGLYLDPAANTVVWSVDQNSGMQATSRVNPTKPATPGARARQEFEYQRNSTPRVEKFLNYNRRAKPFRWTYDSRPRKILDWRTPAELFDGQIHSVEQACVASIGSIGESYDRDEWARLCG